MITVFTPTYNRAHLLTNLFKSLNTQTVFNFEWIIVDDGSTDNTKDLINQFNKKTRFPIKYHYQINSGKHIAINKGIELAIKQFFFIVDSDDLLFENSIELINTYANKIINNKKFAGICGLKTYFNEEIVGGKVNYNELECTLIDYRYKYKIKGDKAEVFKTSILKKYPFPTTQNEKFCPESLIWNRIGNQYNFLFINKKLYKCEYLDEGLTSNIFKIRANSPINTLSTYSELTKYNIPFLSKIKAALNFWRFSKYDKETKFTHKFKKINFLLSILTIVPGILIYLKEKNKLK